MIAEIGRCIHVYFLLFPLLSHMFLNVYNQVFIKCMNGNSHNQMQSNRVNQRCGNTQLLNESQD